MENKENKTPSIIVVPDIHGENFWTEIKNYNLSEVKKIIFLGDYFDSFTKNYDEQMQNFKDIVNFKEANPDKVELLIGNHDIHYITFNGCSGFSEIFKYQIKSLLSPLIQDGIIKVFHIENNVLYSHAGLTKTFLENVVEDFDIKSKNFTDLIDKLNDLLKVYPSAFEFQKSRKMSEYPNVYGDNIWQSPLWIRPYSLCADAIEGYMQVVGHTPLNSISIRTTTAETTVVFTDCGKLFVDDNVLEIIPEEPETPQP